MLQKLIMEVMELLFMNKTNNTILQEIWDYSKQQELNLWITSNMLLLEELVLELIVFYHVKRNVEDKEETGALNAVLKLLTTMVMSLTLNTIALTKL